MARAMFLMLPARDRRAESISRLESARAERAEALLAVYDVRQCLHDRGVFELLGRRVVAGSDR